MTQDEEKRGLLNLLVTFGVVEPKAIIKKENKYDNGLRKVIRVQGLDASVSSKKQYFA